jgi:hypothetical protein
MIKKGFFLAAFFLFWIVKNNILFGQMTGQCGTMITTDQINLENTFTITDSNTKESLPQVKRTLSITVFVVKESKAPYFDASSVLPGAIDKLNEFFSPIALHFKICATNYINNYQFDSICAGSIKCDDILVQNAEPNTINLYLVTELYDHNKNKIKAFTYMPGDNGKHCIFIDKAYISGTTTTLAHQMGHFFNLYHTHESEAFGAELVNETNCATAGDRCCDTNADPDVENYLKNGVYIGTVKDINKELYSPSPKNIMSFGTEDIRCFFSRVQFLRMVYTLNNFRNTLR